MVSQTVSGWEYEERMTKKMLAKDTMVPGPAEVNTSLVLHTRPMPEMHATIPTTNTTTFNMSM